MAISEAHAGRRYPPSAPYEVSAVQIAAFAAALGEDEPRPASEDLVAPLTFLAVITSSAWQAMFEDPELDLALRRVVHGDQRFTFGRPLRAGDKVAATLVIDKVRTRGPSAIITVSVEIRTLSDELIGTGTANLFHTPEPSYAENAS